VRHVLWLILGLLVLPASPGQAELLEAGDVIGISPPAVGWVLRFPAPGVTLHTTHLRQDGRVEYYLFTQEGTGLNMSFTIEPATQCPTAVTCREFAWAHRHPSLAHAQEVTRFERNGFALLECTVTFRVPTAPGGTVVQHHVFGHLIREGYWVNLHLSMMPSKPSDRQVFLDFVDTIRIEPKGK
jgi:hypothetical protein